MSEPLTWPPSPSTPEPLSAHDEFLSACIRNSMPKPLLSRLRLVRDLRQETGQDLRSCLAVVNDFCDRHAILMSLGGFRAWLPFLFLGLCPVIELAMNSVRYFLGNSLAKAVTHSRKSALLSERVHLDFVFFGLLLASLILTLISFLYRHKKIQADAEEARAKFAR